MTDIVHPTAGEGGKSEAFSTVARVAGGDWFVPDYVDLLTGEFTNLAAGPYGAFAHLGSDGTDITIDTGELIVDGRYVARDTQTTITVDDTEQYIEIGYDKTATNGVVVDYRGNLIADNVVTYTAFEVDANGDVVEDGRMFRQPFQPIFGGQVAYASSGVREVEGITMSEQTGDSPVEGLTIDSSGRPNAHEFLEVVGTWDSDARTRYWHPDDYTNGPQVEAGWAPGQGPGGEDVWFVGDAGAGVMPVKVDPAGDQAWVSTLEALTSLKYDGDPVSVLKVQDSTPTSADRGQFWQRDGDGGDLIWTVSVFAGSTESVTTSPDHPIAVGDDDGTIKILDGANGGELGSVQNHSAGTAINDLAWDPNDVIVYSAGQDDTVQAHELQSDGTLTQLWSVSHHTSDATAVDAFSEYVVSGGADNEVIVMDATDGSLARTRSGHTDTVQNVAFYQRDVISTGGSSEEVLRQQGHNYAANIAWTTDTSPVNAIELAAWPENDYVFMGGSQDGTIYQLDTQDGTLIRQLHTEHETNTSNITGMDLHDGRLFSVDGAGKVVAADLRNGSIHWTATAPNAVNGVAVNVGELAVAEANGDVTLLRDRPVMRVYNGENYDNLGVVTE